MLRRLLGSDRGLGRTGGQEGSWSLKQLRALLPIYRTLADSASYYAAEAEVAHLAGELNDTSLDARQRTELNARVLGRLQALVKAIGEWQGDKFYAPQGGNDNDSHPFES